MSKINSSQKTNKTWSFEKNGLKLDFSLPVDTKQPMIDFLAILKVAIKELEKDIGIINNQ